MYYIGLKDTSTVKGNLFITSTLEINCRGNYVLDFDDCKGDWHLLQYSDIELAELKISNVNEYNKYKKFQKRKEVSPEDFVKSFDILSQTKL